METSSVQASEGAEDDDAGAVKSSHRVRGTIREIRDELSNPVIGVSDTGGGVTNHLTLAKPLRLSTPCKHLQANAEVSAVRYASRAPWRRCIFATLQQELRCSPSRPINKKTFTPSKLGTLNIDQNQPAGHGLFL